MVCIFFVFKEVARPDYECTVHWLDKHNGLLLYHVLYRNSQVPKQVKKLIFNISIDQKGTKNTVEL